MALDVNSGLLDDDVDGVVEQLDGAVCCFSGAFAAPDAALALPKHRRPAS